MDIINLKYTEKQNQPEHGLQELERTFCSEQQRPPRPHLHKKVEGFNDH